MYTRSHSYRLCTLLASCFVLWSCSGDDSEPSGQEQDDILDAQRNLRRSLDWLEANSTKEGVVTRSSGLQYKVLESGDASAPLITTGDYVCTHAAGRLVDNTPFWAQEAPDPAIAFKSDKVIKGWQEVLMLMRPGDIWEVYIPPALAYGDQRRSDIIGPNDALVFKLWLYGSSKEPFAEDHDCREFLETSN